MTVRQVDVNVYSDTTWVRLRPHPIKFDLNTVGRTLFSFPCHDFIKQKDMIVGLALFS